MKTYIFEINRVIIKEVVDCLETIESFKYEIFTSPDNSG